MPSSPLLLPLLARDVIMTDGDPVAEGEVEEPALTTRVEEMEDALVGVCEHLLSLPAPPGEGGGDPDPPVADMAHDQGAGGPAAQQRQKQ